MKLNVKWISNHASINIFIRYELWLLDLLKLLTKVARLAEIADELRRKVTKLEE